MIAYSLVPTNESASYLAKMSPPRLCALDLDGDETLIMFKSSFHGRMTTVSDVVSSLDSNNPDLALRVRAALGAPLG